MREAGFDSAADAAGMLDASLDYLAVADWASLGTAAHAEMLARLQRAQRFSQPTAPLAAPLEIPVRLISHARADRCPSG